MKQSTIGFGFCALGCLLYAVNYFSAALYVPHVTSWPTAGGKIAGAFSAVGYTPTMIGILLFIIGLVLIKKSGFQK